ncbi:MAG: MFS transporter, partial [Nocardioidaceae bacterium]
AFGAVEIVSGLMPSYATFAVVTPLLGLTVLTMITAANTSVQLSVAPAMRGRVMALYMMIFQGGTPLGAPIVGWVGNTFGARWTLLGGGAMTIAGILLAVVVFARFQARRVVSPAEPARADEGAAGKVAAGRA